MVKRLPNKETLQQICEKIIMQADITPLHSHLFFDVPLSKLYNGKEMSDGIMKLRAVL